MEYELRLELDRMIPDPDYQIYNHRLNDANEAYEFEIRMKPTVANIFFYDRILDTVIRLNNGSRAIIRWSLGD